MGEPLFSKILLPVDGSAHALKAAHQALALAGPSGAAVLLVHCRRHISDLLGEPYYQQLLDRVMVETNQLLAPYRALLQEAGVVWEELVLEGDPAERIRTAAEVEHCDLIVMGSRGLSDVGGLILGSVSHKVISNAPCPVLTVRSEDGGH